MVDQDRPTTIVVHATARPEGRAAVDRALTHAAERPNGARLLVVLSGADHQGATGYFSPAAEQAITEALTASGLAHEVHHVGEEDPVQSVLDLIEEHSADLLVTGIRRRSRTMKFLLGSHTQQLILDAECPVLAVKGPRDAE